MPLPLIVPAIAACCGGYLAGLHESEQVEEPPALPLSNKDLVAFQRKRQNEGRVEPQHPSARSRAYFHALKSSSGGSNTEFHRVQSKNEEGSTKSEGITSDACKKERQGSCSSIYVSYDGCRRRKSVVTISANGLGAEITTPLTGKENGQIGYRNGRFTEGKVHDVVPSTDCWTVRFSPDSSLISVGLRENGGVAIYDSTSFQLLETIDSESTISVLEWKRTGRGDHASVLATGALNGAVKVIQVTTIRKAASLLSEKDGFHVGVSVKNLCTVNLKSDVRSLDFFPNDFPAGVSLVLGEQNGQVSVLSHIKFGNCVQVEPPVLRRVDLHSSAVLSLAVSRDSMLVASGSASGVLRIYDIRAEALNVESLDLDLKLHQEQPIRVPTSVEEPQNKTDTLKRELRKEKGVRTLSLLFSDIREIRREGAIRAIVFSMDSRVLIAGGYDKRIVMIDTEMWQPVREMHHDGTVNSMAFDAAHRYLAVGSRDKLVTIYDTSTFHPIKTIPTAGWATSLSWAGSGQFECVLAVRSAIQLISVYKIHPIRLLARRLETSAEGGSALSFSNNGLFLARANGNFVVVVSTTGGFENVATARREGVVRDVRFCMNEEMQNVLAVVCDAGFLAVFQLCRSAGTIYPELLHESFLGVGLRAVAWSHDGTSLAAGGKGEKVHMISSPDFAKRCDPIDVEGRIRSIDFLSASSFEKIGEKLRSISMAVGTDNSMAILFNASRCQPTLRILRPRSVRCVRYHPTLPILSIGDSNRVVLIDLITEQVIKEFNVGFRVNALEYSPCGRFLALADDRYVTVRETLSFDTIQMIPCRGGARSVAFERNGQYLVVDNSNSNVMILQLGSLLGIEFLPLKSEGSIDDLPLWALEESIFRSNDGPSLLQRFMYDGSQRCVQDAAQVLKRFPEAIYTFDRRTGEDCFSTASKLGKPVILELVMTTLVNGSLEIENGKRSFLTSSVPDKGFDALFDMISFLPPKQLVGILNKMAFVKVPFSEAIICSTNERKECASAEFTSPWGNRMRAFEDEDAETADFTLNAKIDHKKMCALTPAVLPLPNLGSFRFLKALTKECPPSVFDNDAMGLVLRILWNVHIQHFFLLDLSLFAFFYVMWIVFVDVTASSTGSRATLSETIALGSIILLLNTAFSIKEVVQSGYGKKIRYFFQLWNITDILVILLVYTYTITTMIPNYDAGNGLVYVAVFGTLALTMKLLSYLRGFHNTGWLISVLRRNFRDVRGFAVVLAVIVVGFTVCFRLLFASVIGECPEDAGVLCDARPYGSLSRAFLSTYELSILGSYEQVIFEANEYKITSAILFVLATAVVTVVALNALIALLGDSYSRVQESAAANQRFERAELIVEYMSLLPCNKLKEIDRNTRYFHALLEADDGGDLLINKDDWHGGLKALGRDINAFNETENEETRAAISQMKTELNNDIAMLRAEMLTALQEMHAEVKDVRRMQHNYAKNLLANVGDKPVSTAVKVVKTIGSRIPRPRHASAIPTAGARAINFSSSFTYRLPFAAEEVDNSP